MIPGLVQALSSPAGVLAIVVGLLSLALGRTSAWPLLAVRPAGAVVITATLAAAVYVGVTALTAVFNT